MGRIDRLKKRDRIGFSQAINQQRIMNKNSIILLPSILLVAQVNLNAQVYSQNLVGYVNFDFYAGVNLFGNPLDDSVNVGTPLNAINKLSSIFPNSGQGAPPDGTEVALWNAASDSYGPSSVFNAGSWSTDLTLLPGTGAELIAPTTFNATFVGGVENHDGSPATSPGLFPPPPVFSGPNGIYLRADACPTKDVGSDVFLNIFGRLPNPGEKVTLLDAATQTYVTDTYLGNDSWDNVPTLQVGQAAFFAINSVPEPSTVFAGFVGLGLALASCWRR
jgi:hypothetical protein